MELILLDRLAGKCRNLFLALSPIPREGHPFANNFTACPVIFFHVQISLAEPYLNFVKNFRVVPLEQSCEKRIDIAMEQHRRDKSPGHEAGTVLVFWLARTSLVL
jgi:hypothetical protein